jgi:hypothetical protein
MGGNEPVSKTLLVLEVEAWRATTEWFDLVGGVG